MKHKSAVSANEEIFQEQKLSFKKVPNQTKLFLDYQQNSEYLQAFYPSIKKNLSDFAKEVLENYKVDRDELCDILLEENKGYNVGKNTLENIEKLRREDCVAVITGQQAGLFSGPLYTVYKALSAIRLAEELTKKDIDAVPIFWIASEDHDFDEINKTNFVDHKENLNKVENTLSNLQEGSPVGFIDFDENIKTTIDSFIGKLPQTEFTDEISKILISCYDTNETYSSAFGKLMAKLTYKFGVIFVSPLNKKLRNLCSPVFEDAIKNSETIKSRLLIRNDELKENSLHSQVLVEEDFFPFFYVGNDNKRNALRFDLESNKIKSQNSKYEFTKEEIFTIANETPQKLSPNALMRPIVQDYLFPTICYYGGGAEIAYFGQNSVIYEVLDRPHTPIRHRASFTIIQGKHRRTLNKYNLSFEELFVGKEKILAEIIEKFINPKTSEQFTKTKNIIKTQLEELDSFLSKDEPTLSDNLANRKKKILWHIETLRKKFHLAETKKNELINRQIESLFTTNLPNGGLQERTINLLYFLNLYGMNLIDWLYDAVDSEETNHQIIIF